MSTESFLCITFTCLFAFRVTRKTKPMSSNNHGGSCTGAGRLNTKAKGTRKLSSYFESLRGPGEPPVAPTPTEAEVAATEKAITEKSGKEKAVTDCRERIQMELRERCEQDLTNQEKGLELLAEAATTENNGVTAGVDIQEEEEEESDHESNDESWDSDNDEEDDEECISNKPGTKKNRRNCQAYKPQAGSDFRMHLNGIKATILDGEDKAFLQGKHEYPPVMDPLVKHNNTNATDWYEGQYHIYVWFPFLQYKASCQLQSFSHLMSC